MVDVLSNNTEYQKFIDNLNSSGIRTTSINSSKEADFGEYGAALSDSLKQQICDSFDCEQDYALQQKIAGLYTNRSVLNSGEFISACQGLGLNVSVEYQQTSYISDYKAGNFSNSVGNGSIAVYTISDGMGGEIKIADANGNGALESEELFMNQILGDINTDIGNIAPAITNTQNADGTVSSAFGTAQEDEVSQSNFDKAVERYIEKGYSETTATLRANLDYGVNMNYTGTMTSENEEEETEGVTQTEFNNMVAGFMDVGFTEEDAVEIANTYLSVDMEYTEESKSEKEKEEPATV